MANRAMILTFKDEQGQEWLAGAELGPLLRYEEGEHTIARVAERLQPEELLDRAFSLVGIKIVSPE